MHVIEKTEADIFLIGRRVWICRLHTFKFKAVLDTSNTYQSTEGEISELQRWWSCIIIIQGESTSHLQQKRKTRLPFCNPGGCRREGSVYGLQRERRCAKSLQDGNLWRLHYLLGHSGNHFWYANIDSPCERSRGHGDGGRWQVAEENGDQK